ncbi:MAG: hypothetical protein IRY90_08780 [Actinomadura rubrobrunea]|nr:hypothetical protein [Actinomadura rubrobrunea]
MTPERLMPRNQRRSHLEALKAALAPQEVHGTVVERRGFPLLRVVRLGTARVREVGCDYVRGVWWFVWADTGETIGSADRTDMAARKIAQALRN